MGPAVLKAAPPILSFWAGRSQALGLWVDGGWVPASEGVTVPSGRTGPPGGGECSGHTLCTGDVPPSRVCFSQILSGKGAVFSPTVWQGYVLTVSVWQGCCFQAQQSGKGCVLILVWHWNSGKDCNFTFFCFSGEGGKFRLGRVRLCHPGLHTGPYP